MVGSEPESSRSRGNRDMLSSLPDLVLHHIMSFMLAREAVQLCVLSKRWKTLWTTLPVLNFGFREPENIQLCEPLEVESEPLEVERLVEFISTVLFLREATSQLHTFTLDCDSWDVGSGCMLCKSIGPWFRYANKCNLRVFTIRIIMDEIILLPSEVFTCSSLEYFTLTSTGRIDTPEIINLPSLKQLHLRNQELDQDFMSKLLFGCPVLEDLQVEGPSFEISKITSHSLKHLKIMQHCPSGSMEYSEMIIINSPNLLSFDFEMCTCCQKNGITFNMPSLHEAYIEFAVCTDDVDDEPDVIVTESNILSGLINVNRLVLKGILTLVTTDFSNQQAPFYRLEACLEADIANCRTFSKLTCLSVSDLCLNCIEFDLLSSLLEHCPNLKKLTVGPSGCGCKLWSTQIKVARFKCEQLETVEVKFNVKDRAFHLVVKCLQEAVAELPNCRIITTSA